MDLNETIIQLEQIHNNFRLLVGSNGTAEGNLQSGHAICSTCPQEAPPTEGGIQPSPPPPPTGACCNGPTCTVDTEAHCISGGGTYQGDGTLCTPNPCVACSNCGFGAFGGTPDACLPNGCLRINCDGTYSDPAPTPGLLYLTATCTECDTGIQHITTVDPVTCMTNEECSCLGFCNSCICPECYNPPYCGPFSVQLSDPVPAC